jgi:peptidoglycan recognition protein
MGGGFFLEIGRGMKVITRSSWGGPAAPFGEVMRSSATSVTVHHPYPHELPIGATAAQEMNEVRAIHRFHDTRWLGIGYNFIITQNGRVYEGRGWGRVGAHAGTEQGNQTSIGVAFLIDGNKAVPSAMAQIAFDELRAQGVADAHLTPDHTIKLHRDWKQTQCPGTALSAWARARDARPPRSLKLGSRGDDVRELQERLGVQPQTGYFGPVTAAAVKNFQRKHGLIADGIVGPLTRAKL